VDAHGRTTAIDAVGPGCAFPIEPSEGDDAPSSTAASYAVTRTLVCLCKEQPIETSLRGGGDTALDLHKLHCEALHRMERLADARGRSVAASRVAALLCTLADTLVRRESGSSRIPAGFLQRDFAALLSIRHESVCRSMRDFSKRGLISQETDGIHLLERSRLEAI
jgi:CRP-like cAMP-binding protein